MVCVGAKEKTSVPFEAHVSFDFPLCSPPSLPLYRGRKYFYYGQTAYLVQVRQPGPAVRTRSGFEGVVKLVFVYPFSFSALVDLDHD